jgi:hypothetical protein
MTALLGGDRIRDAFVRKFIGLPKKACKSIGMTAEVNAQADFAISNGATQKIICPV